MDNRKDCCKKEENLEAKQLKPDLMVNVCKVCGCRHFELSVDSGKIFGKISAIG